MEELPYINDLTACLLRSSSLTGTPKPFLSIVYLCLASILMKHFCLLSHLLLCYVSNNKLCTCIYSFCLCDKCIFHWGQRSREK